MRDAIDAFWASWHALKPGQAFSRPGRSEVYIKMGEDPFSAPIGDAGYFCLDTGVEGTACDLLDTTRPLMEQIRTCDLLPHYDLPTGDDDG